MGGCRQNLLAREVWIQVLTRNQFHVSHNHLRSLLSHVSACFHSPYRDLNCSGRYGFAETSASSTSSNLYPNPTKRDASPQPRGSPRRVEVGSCERIAICIMYHCLTL